MRDSAGEKLSPILDDQPSSVDFLDFASYVQALKELVVHSKTRTPLTLGIFGRWGMGKTTLMKMLEEDLTEEGITTIWFNAWQYSDEDELWAAFLQSMLNKIQRSLGAFRLPIFKINLFLKRIRWNEVPQSLLVYLFRVIVALLPVLLIDLVSEQFTPEAKPILDIGGRLATFVLSIWIVGKPLFDSIQKNVSINISDFQKTSNYQEHIAFLDQFREHFSDIVQSLPKRGDKRLAVFIDDLDRCPPERTIQVLDAIKLFVDVEGCVYILGLDVDVVQKAVASKYKDDPTAQREYMSKIIQLPFQLPPLTRDEMQKFLEQLTFGLPDPKCQNVFITGLVVNPREVKRTINIFSLLWNLAAKRKELTGKINPVRLAKIVVIQQGYADLHKILQYRPYLLIELERFFREEEKGKPLMPSTEAGVINQADQIKQSIDLSPELVAFSNNESLRQMLLLHKLPESEEIKDEYSFAKLEIDEVAVYFTLTSRAEAPKPVISQESASMKTTSFVGDLIGGRYRVNYEIGRGGISTVYLAHDQGIQREVALKMLSGELMHDPNIIRRFNQEIKTLAGLSHPNLVPLYDIGSVNGQPYFTMQYLPGGSLKEKLIEKSSLSSKEIAKFLSPVLDAMIYLHEKGIVHRDIKPSTILFDSNNKPYITDFSIAKLSNNYITQITEVGMVIGTPTYMSPEQWTGNEIDARSDLYSFGVLLFECVTGQPPYHGENLMAIMYKQTNDAIPSSRDLKPDISIELEKVIMKLLAKNPDERYQTAREVKKALMTIYPEADKAL